MGRMVGDDIAVNGEVHSPFPVRVHSARDVCNAVRERVHELNITYAEVERLCGLGDTHVDKLLRPFPVKSIGMLTMFALVQYLGLGLMIFEDKPATKKMKSQISLRRGPGSMAALRQNGVHKRHPNFVSKRFLRKIAVLGGLAAAHAKTPEERSEQGRKGARARWGRSAQARKAARVRWAGVKATKQYNINATASANTPAAP